MNITMSQIEAVLNEVKRVAEIVRPEVEKEMAKKAGVTVEELRMVLETDLQKKETIDQMAVNLAMELMKK